MHGVLLVPDRLLDLSGGSSLLERRSIRLRSARTAAEALSILSVWSADLVVTSNVLPGHVATDFLRAVRTQAPAGRILLISEQLTHADDAEVALVDSRLVDPVDEHAFYETVASLLEANVRAPRRVEHLMAAVLRPDQAGSGEVACIRRIGPTTCELEMQDAIAIGTSIELRFSLPRAAGVVSVTARVARPVDEVQLVFHCEIDPTTEASRAVLARFFESE